MVDYLLEHGATPNPSWVPHSHTAPPASNTSYPRLKYSYRLRLNPLNFMPNLQGDSPHGAARRKHLWTRKCGAPTVASKRWPQLLQAFSSLYYFNQEESMSQVACVACTPKGAPSWRGLYTHYVCVYIYVYVLFMCIHIIYMYIYNTYT